jgi:hypothetical protein
MFGHLKAQDFMNLMEGSDLPAKQREHLQGCPRCNSTWQSVRSVHSEVTSLNTDIPEPDWTEFRASVRDRLLSRSIQRESAVRRWTGWAIRPAMAWALSLFLAVGITTAALLWKTQPENVPAPPVLTPVPSVPVNELLDVEATAVWPQTSLFDDLVQLSDSEQEQLRLMLESAAKGALQRQ